MKIWTYRSSHEEYNAIQVSLFFNSFIMLAGRHMYVCTQERRCNLEVATSLLPEADFETDSPSTFTLAAAISMFSKSVYLQLQVIRALCKIDSKLLCLIKTSQPMPLGYSQCSYLLLKKAVWQCICPHNFLWLSVTFIFFIKAHHLSTVKVNFASHYEYAFSSMVSDWYDNVQHLKFNYIDSANWNRMLLFGFNHVPIPLPPTTMDRNSLKLSPRKICKSSCREPLQKQTNKKRTTTNTNPLVVLAR